MKDRLYPEERKFAHIIWRKEPLSTTELVQQAAKELGWKRTTSYTVLKRLCEKGLFETDNGMVRALVPQEEYYSQESRSYVRESFGGSLPAFIAAFVSDERISPKEAKLIRKLIREAEEAAEQDETEE